MEALRSTPIRVFSVAIVVLVTMAVGRWWVVAAMAGPFGALLVLQLTGHMSHELDGSAPPLNVVAIFGLVYVGVLLLILVAVRKLLDLCLRRVADVRRSRRATVGP
jgi:hypothetical protein